MKNCLIVFAKDHYSVPVKTRLRSILPVPNRRRLYEAFLEDTARLARRCDCPLKVLAYESAGQEPEVLKEIFKGFICLPQKGDSLGQRLHNAFRLAGDLKAGKTVVIGSDSPTLPPAIIDQAFSGMEKNDIALGPAIDGGYYLIGLKKSCQYIFRGINWSSGAVLAQTLKKAQHLKKKVILLAEGYDVDDGRSLKLLRNELACLEDQSVAARTRQLLKELKYDPGF